MPPCCVAGEGKGPESLRRQINENIPLDASQYFGVWDALLVVLHAHGVVTGDMGIAFRVQDLPNAMNAADITDKLGLHSLRQRNWYIQATCATSGEGLYEGLDWLSGQLAKKG